LSIAVGVSGAVLGGALAIMRPKLRVIVFPIPVPPGDVYNMEKLSLNKQPTEFYVVLKSQKNAVK